MPGSKSCTNKWLLITWVEKALSSSAASVSINGPDGGPPALLTNICIGPFLDTHVATIVFAASGAVKSSVKVKCCWPVEVSNSFMAAINLLSVRLAIITVAPSNANSLAVAKPSPCDPPQTSAVLFCKLRFIIKIYSLLFPG